MIPWLAIKLLLFTGVSICGAIKCIFIVGLTKLDYPTGFDCLSKAVFNLGADRPAAHPSRYHAAWMLHVDPTRWHATHLPSESIF